jgi:hypothetical protein
MALDRVLHDGLKPRSFDEVCHDRETLRIGMEAPSDNPLPVAEGGDEMEVQLPAIRPLAGKPRRDPMFTASLGTALLVIEVGWVFTLLWTVTWVFR